MHLKQQNMNNFKAYFSKIEQAKYFISFNCTYIYIYIYIGYGTTKDTQTVVFCVNIDFWLNIWFRFEL